MLMRTQATALTLALALAGPAIAQDRAADDLAARTETASSNAFGQCAHQRDPDMKITACRKASGQTSYPWILQWVYRELARAHSERGEFEKAIASYARSLAAADREGVRREMEELLVTQ